MSNLYLWNKDLVALLKDQNNKALVKVINSDRYKTGSVHNVLWQDLKKSSPTKKPPFNNTACPNCGTSSPNYIDGIECPGCGYLGFKEWFYKL